MGTQTKLTLTVTSPAFGQSGLIPSKYTCEGENINPALEIKSIPQETKSLVLIIDDPDAPGGTFDHWIVWNIPPAENIEENSIPGTEGMNNFGKIGYRGPCPPSGIHRYFFKIYALDSELDIKKGAKKKQVEDAMKGHIIASGELIGTYRKKGG